MLNDLIKDLKRVTNPQKAQILSRFFKTGKGEYGEGDVFAGIVVPESRKVAKKYVSLTLSDTEKLLQNKIHEYRLTALLLLVEKYKIADKDAKKKIVNIYFKNLKNKKINNWDLVDLSAPKIVGDYFFDKDKKKLYVLTKSKNLWERRVAILATYDFIRRGNYFDTLEISKKLMNDKEDLIHKAVGWMLREIGKRDEKIEKIFLNEFATRLPRTILRYAIERFSVDERRKYLNLKLSLK